MNEELAPGKFILDSTQVWRQEPFCSFMLNDNIRALGLRLPKMIPIYNKKGEVIGDEQSWEPAVITSEPNIFDGDKNFQHKTAIRFRAVPSDMELRWPLESISNFLAGKPPTSLKDIFGAIRGQYQALVHFQNKTWYDIHALWDIGTYFYSLFPAYPLLELAGLPGTGKTKVMAVSRRITFNATPIMINPSEAALFRETHAKRPTKYFDEAEKIFRFDYKTRQTESDNRAELINASYMAGGCVPRAEKTDNDFRIVYYDCYSPTMIASVKSLAGTGATESRAISHIMTRAGSSDTRGELDPEETNPEVWQTIRSELYGHYFYSWRSVKDSYDFYSAEGIKARDFQLWRPILALAQLIGPEVHESVLKFAQAATTQRKDDFIPDGSMDYRILDAFASVISLGPRIHISQIKDAYKITLPEGQEPQPGLSRTISNHLDKLGFKEFRSKDNGGAYFEVPIDVFVVIVSPICPSIVKNYNLSSQSSQSSLSLTKQQNLGDEQVTNG